MSLKKKETKMNKNILFETQRIASRLHLHENKRQNSNNKEINISFQPKYEFLKTSISSKKFEIYQKTRSTVISRSEKFHKGSIEDKNLKNKQEFEEFSELISPNLTLVDKTFESESLDTNIVAENLMHNKSQNSSILKSPKRERPTVKRPTSKVSFCQEPLVVKFDKWKVLPQKAIKLKSGSRIGTPPRPENKVKEKNYEIVYKHNCEIKSRESSCKSRIDLDRINYLFDNIHGNIRVIYNDDDLQNSITLTN